MTAPVRDAYFAMGHTSLIRTLEAISGWIPKWSYPSQESTLRPEWGSVSNCRYLLSSIGSVSTAASANSADVYNVFHVGMEAIGAIEQDGYSAQFLYRPPIYDGPLALNSSVNKPADVKSALIEMEALTSDVEGDIAQAEAEMLLAA